MLRELVVGKSLFREDFIGSPGRARTADLVINSHPLYQLSYRGIGGRILIPASEGVNKPARAPTLSDAFEQMPLPP